MTSTDYHVNSIYLSHPDFTHAKATLLEKLMSTITDLTNATSALVAANASLANEIAALSTALANRSGLSASDQAALDGAVAQLDAAASDITNQVQALTALQNS